ncbi:hypothetical protein BDN70DRAFT_900483 [Pholiota conissans]|uniref:Uncharacterized protein n=1 Tax=Pholiota conissans TaxID=109636 RepID=A0A9P5YRW3_9AGAR|nr:hypothetical protein BDN70DRAFT_900483 [Pholiota conissans]
MALSFPVLACYSRSCNCGSLPLVPIACLLCPLKCLQEFDRDPEHFMGNVLDGMIKLTALQWPSFLYPSNTVYNPEFIDEGLFRSPIMIHVFGHCVAYVVVQAYFSLSSIEQWSSSPQNSYFDLDDFFDRCVGLFEKDPTDPWIEQTLDYLTRYIKNKW